MSVNSVLYKRVIDNTNCTMLDSLIELLPLGNSLSIAVGYFHLSGYKLLRDVFNSIALRGHVRILMGNKTDQRTADEIETGLNTFDMDPKKALEKQIKSIDQDSDASHLIYNLRDLIAAGRVSIKVYIGPSDYFHAKAYLIGRENERNDGYAIIGSSNFSKGGFTGNSELNILTMDSYPNIYMWFDDLWNSNDVDDFSYDLIQIIDAHLTRPRGYNFNTDNLINESNNSKIIQPDYSSIIEGIQMPSSLTLRPYQLQAIYNWFKANGRGTLKMATGSGKTITALALSFILHHKIDLDAIIIICPYRHLVTQWNFECERFGYSPILCFESRYKWVDTLKAKLYNSESILPLVVITTNTTFSLASFQSCLPFFPKKTLIIADEVHNLGSTNLLNSLPSNIVMRLGLSATPERWFDDKGTQGLFDYFGNVLDPEFTLREAINCGALVKYTYHPVFVSLTDEEIDEYIDISKQLNKIKYLIGDNSFENPTNSTLSILLSRRARLLGTAKNKLFELRKLMQNRLNTTHTLFYCGDGSVEEEESEELIRHFEIVCKLLGTELNYRIHSYTAETSLHDREEIRHRLDTGELQGLVAIRCLDEGVDIPSISTAVILASSSNPRQFIQRRGRVLRKHEGKTEAEIYDMIVVPPMDDSIDFEIERKLLSSEFRRYLEFASIAKNSGQVKGLISDIQTKYSLHSL